MLKLILFYTYIAFMHSNISGDSPTRNIHISSRAH